MSHDLGTLLGEAAEGARNYASAECAITLAERRRRTRGMISGAMALVLLVSGGWLLSSRDRAPLPADPPARSHPAYPPLVSPPASAEPLPTKRAIGVASFVYTTCLEDCPGYLVTPEGDQYLLPRLASQAAGLAPYTLSPDGRYLGWQGGNQFLVRDLQSSSVIAIDVPGEGDQIGMMTWSPDSRFALVARHGNVSPRTFVRVDLTGASANVVVPIDDSPVETREEIEGMLNSGDLVLVTHNHVNPLTRIRVVEAATLKELQIVLVNASAVLGMVRANGGESVDRLLSGPHGLAFKADEVMTAIERPTPPLMHGPTQAGLVRIDQGTGQILGWVDNPAPVVRRNKYVSLWEIVADLDEGYLALNWYPERAELVLIDPLTGVRNVVTRLPAGAVVIARSAVWPAF